MIIIINVIIIIVIITLSLMQYNRYAISAIYKLRIYSTCVLLIFIYINDLPLHFYKGN